MHLFVDRADDDDDEEDEEDSDDDNFASYVDRQLTEGEISMQEPRKVESVDTEMTQLMAEGLGERTLSRKERRELQKRQEAAAAEDVRFKAEPVAQDAESDDEPTREFMPISRERTAANRSIEPPVSLFDSGDEERCV